MFTPKGKFSWYEIMTSDTKATGKFYSDVVGWTTQEMLSGDGPPYTTFNLGKVGIAGMLHMIGHTSWIGYISVGDVDAHIEKIVEAGGKLLGNPLTDVPGMLFASPSYPIRRAPQSWCLHARPEHMPSPCNAHAPPTPGTIGWHEALHN